jgi:putative NADPH-quinone reductase
MARRIVIIDGHPDATAKRYIHALAKAYEKGAVEAGHEVRVAWADHLVIIYPLWLGSMPGMLKSFFEQLLRPGFAFAPAAGRGMPRKLLKGRSRAHYRDHGHAGSVLPLVLLRSTTSRCGAAVAASDSALVPMGAAQKSS